MTSSCPRLSVFTISLNHAKFLKETIRSIECQTFTDYEYIFCDGMSSDGTQDILKEYPWIQWTSEPDGEYGAFSAFCKGLERVRGEYLVQCCVSDGFLDKEWFEDAVQILDDNPQYAMVWASEQRADESGALLGPVRPEYFERPPPSGMDAFCYWLATGVTYHESNYVVRTNIFKECWPNENSSPSFHKVNPHIAFIFNFHCAGYQARYVHKIASWSRLHEQQRFLTRRSIEFPAAKKYRNDIRRLIVKILFGRSNIKLDGGYYQEIVRYSRRDKLEMVKKYLFYKLVYSRFMVRSLYMIYISIHRRFRKA